MKLKPVDLLMLVVWVIVVAIWVVRLVSDAISGSAGVNITLAVVWIASLCVMLYRYWKGRKGKE